jgi:hypothetical protein
MTLEGPAPSVWVCMTLPGYLKLWCSSCLVKIKHVQLSIVCLKSRGFNGNLGICLVIDAMMHMMDAWVVDIAADKSHSSCNSEVCAWLGVVYTETLSKSQFLDDDATITST